MDLTAINSPTLRPGAATTEPRSVPLTGATEPASKPQTVDAVRQPAEVQALADRRDERRAGELTDDEMAVVRELKARDREVRAHEQAHKLVGGQYAGAISYEYQRGPDGRDYAIGGSVPIDTAREPTPEETASKMRIVIKAALAPAEPSAADRAIAAAAQAKLLDAQAEIAARAAAERRGVDPEAASGPLAVYARTEQPADEPQIAFTV